MAIGLLSTVGIVNICEYMDILSYIFEIYVHQKYTKFESNTHNYLKKNLLFVLFAPEYDQTDVWG